MPKKLYQLYYIYCHETHILFIDDYYIDFILMQ